MKKSQTGSFGEVVRMFPFDGDVDFIEVDGAKFQVDENGEAKKDAEGKNIPYVAPAEDDEEVDLDELAKTNPKLAKIMKDAADTAKQLQDLELEKEKERIANAEKNGEWEKLHKEEKAKRELAEDNLKKKDELLGKFKVSIDNVLKEVMKTIPEDKRGLVPAEFSSRQKLEYITKNAKILGATVTGGKGGVPPNEGNPNGSEKDKLVEEFQGLVKKGATRTSVETLRMTEVGRLIKAETLKQLDKK